MEKNFMDISLRRIAHIGNYIREEKTHEGPNTPAVYLTNLIPQHSIIQYRDCFQERFWSNPSKPSNRLTSRIVSN